MAPSEITASLVGQFLEFWSFTGQEDYQTGTQ